MTIQSHIADILDGIANDYQRIASICRMNGDEPEALFWEHKSAAERERANKKRGALAEAKRTNSGGTEMTRHDYAKIYPTWLHIVFGLGRNKQATRRKQ